MLLRGRDFAIRGRGYSGAGRRRVHSAGRRNGPKNTDAQWRKSFEINVVGSYIAADEAQKIIAAQGTNGSIVLIGSANAVVAKKGSLAYDTSKAAVNHLHPGNGGGIRAKSPGQWRRAR